MGNGKADVCKEFVTGVLQENIAEMVTAVFISLTFAGKILLKDVAVAKSSNFYFPRLIQTISWFWRLRVHPAISAIEKLS